jgi:hypothetical protein
MAERFLYPPAHNGDMPDRFGGKPHSTTDTRPSFAPIQKEVFTRRIEINMIVKPFRDFSTYIPCNPNPVDDILSNFRHIPNLFH